MIPALLAALCWAAAGCGSEPEIAAQGVSAGQEPVVTETEIVFGSATATNPGAWKLWSEQSSATFGDDDESRINVVGVTGDLLEDGEVASKFTSDEGYADTRTGRLVLYGRVSITSVTGNLHLTAAKVTYDEERQLIVAEGDVVIKSTGWTTGSFAKLVTNPSLREFGTPDRFEL